MAGTIAKPEGITNPPIDELLAKVESKYSLVVYASKRARQINAYYEALVRRSLRERWPARRGRLHGQAPFGGAA